MASNLTSRMKHNSRELVRIRGKVGMSVHMGFQREQIFKPRKLCNQTRLDAPASERIETIRETQTRRPFSNFF